MPNLWVKETYVNATRGHRIDESGAYETFTDQPGALYRSLREEYGRCVSRVYVDLQVPTCPTCTSHLTRLAADEPWYCATCDRKIDNPVTARPVGWVFLSRQKYEDARTNRPEDYYLREVWVTILDGPDTVVRTEHHHYLD